MGTIKVIHDATIELPKIEDMLWEPAPEDGATSVSDNPQTHITGILAPLIKFNDMVINPQDIRSFSLRSTAFLPELSFTFVDKLNIISGIDKVTKDSRVQIQIIPPADGMAKKLNMMFMIDSCRVFGDEVSVSCLYKVPTLYDTSFESFGKTTTWSVIEKLSSKMQLGFASDINGTTDERYIYSNGQTYSDVIQREVKHGGDTQVIPDCWIDFKNNIILENIYDRYMHKDQNLKIKAVPSVLQDVRNVPTPFDAPGITNSEAFHNTSLYVESFSMLGDGGSVISRGDNKIVDAFNMEQRSINQIQLIDSDYKETNNYKYFYSGEVFGDYNYFQQKHCNDTFFKKIKTNMIEVTLGQPVLDLERGDRVEFLWYDYNSVLKGMTDVEGADEAESNSSKDPNAERLNTQYSGQYLIVGVSIDFYNSTGSDFKWSYRLQMTKPDNYS